MLDYMNDVMYTIGSITCNGEKRFGVQLTSNREKEMPMLEKRYSFKDGKFFQEMMRPEEKHHCSVLNDTRFNSPNIVSIKQYRRLKSIVIRSSADLTKNDPST
jgi:hypothetical protein